MADPKDDITVEVGLSLDKDDVAKVTAQLKALTKAISDGNEIQEAPQTSGRYSQERRSPLPIGSKSKRIALRS